MVDDEHLCLATEQRRDVQPERACSDPPRVDVDGGEQGGRRQDPDDLRSDAFCRTTTWLECHRSVQREGPFVTIG